MIARLHEILDESAHRDAQKVAMRFGSAALTYGEWLRRANTLARVLVEEGVRPGDRVGIYLNKSLETAVAIYGVWKAGAAYVPFDPTAPVERLRFLVSDCGVRHLVTQPAKAAVARALAGPDGVRCVMGLTPEPGAALRCHSWESLTAESQAPPDVAVATDDLAYVMYTSGSTGLPKGLAHTHRSGLSYARASAVLYEVGPEDVLGNHSPLHFDMSTFEYFTGPLCGATTVIISEAHTKLPASLSALMETERLSIWYSVPFALVQLLLRGALETRNLESLRWVLFGGEPFPTGHLNALMQRWPHARFGNVYGPAEVNQCTYYHVPPEGLPEHESVPIGRIWEAAEGLVLDPRDEPAPPGEAGELVVRTTTMMRGYWGRPDLDAKAFYRRPTDPPGASAFYRTGDQVRLRPDGELQFLGRIDRQVKIRGYRVELDEIEAALGAHPDVEACGVFALPDREGSQRIEARIQAKTGAELSESALRAFAAARLPPYALPAVIRVVADLPRTTTGKIDRNALRELAMMSREATSDS